MLKPPKKNPQKTKKDLKEDKFIETVLNTKDYVEKNSRQVVGVVAAIFIVILIIMFISQRQEQSNLKATTLFGKAQVEYQNFNYSKAKEMLARLMDQYSGTEKGKQGMLFLANIYFQEQNYQQAKDIYYEFTDSYGGSRILLASGYAGYAACLEIEQDYTTAAEFYDKAVKTAPEFVEASNWLYLAGINYQKSGDMPKAEEAFQTILDEYSDSDRTFDAQSQLILLADK